MKSRPRHVAIAYLASGILHVGLVAAMIVAAVPLLINRKWAPVDTAVGEAGPAADVDELLGPDVPADDDDSAKSPEPQPSADALADADLGESRIAEYARRKLEQAREEAADKSVAEQMSELESLGNQLNQISTQESVEAVAEAIAPLIGNSSRATEPAADLDDSKPFDPATAQFYEVHRRGEEGAYEYTALLLDAAGRTREVSLEPEEGAELYKLFDLMKKFPLLETIYRKAALGLLDTMMAEERVELFSEPEASEDAQQPSSDKSDQQD